MTQHDSHDETTGRPNREADPRMAREQETPEPVRPETLQDSEALTRNRLENPPKAEGDRDEAESGPTDADHDR